MHRFSFTQIAQILKATCRYEGNTSMVYDGFRPVMECAKNHISWIRPKVKKAAHYINSTQAGCIICDEEAFKLYTGNLHDTLFIVTSDPLLAFVKILNKAEDKNKPAGQLIHPTAIIHPDCKLGAGVSVGPYSILDECTIGDNTVIGNNVRIHNSVMMGSNCQVREFCSIGGGQYQCFSFDKTSWIFSRRITILQTFNHFAITLSSCDTFCLRSYSNTFFYGIDWNDALRPIKQCGCNCGFHCSITF